MPKTEAAAYLCHCIPGRIRFRIPGQRGDENYFSMLAKKLAALPGIETVQVSPLTGSVLLTHALDAVDDIGAFAKAQGLFEVTPPPDPGLPMGERIANSVHTFNHELKKLSDGAFDYWSLIFFVLIGMAIYQILKGNIAAPATTLLWYALGTLLIAQQGGKIPVPTR